MLEKLKAWIANIVLALMAYQQRRADYFILANMTDNQLKDIGTTRCELKARFYAK
jgi:uncharacterized protein YjiS (DUF1127 family)